MGLRLLLSLLLTLLSFSSAAAAPPRVMLATDFHSGLDISQYWVSEKLDGVRGRWDGHKLVTRSGMPIDAPEWFTAGWPKAVLDGELWIGRGRFDEVSSLVRAGAGNERGWRHVRFMVFDLPDHGGVFDKRVERMRAMIPAAKVPWLQVVPQFRVANAIELEARLKRMVEAGAEGLMLHRGRARYRAGRSDDLIKYKLYQDAEARVIGHAPGKGKYTGMLGALIVRMADGRQFRLGSGFTDAQRADPPPVGSLVTYRYNGLTSKGLPRFARFQRIRSDPPPPDPQ